MDSEYSCDSERVDRDNKINKLNKTYLKVKFDVNFVSPYLPRITRPPKYFPPCGSWGSTFHEWIISEDALHTL